MDWYRFLLIGMNILQSDIRFSQIELDIKYLMGHGGDGGDGRGGEGLYDEMALLGLGQSRHHQEPRDARQEHQHEEGCLEWGVVNNDGRYQRSYKETDYEGNLHVQEFH